MRRRLATLVVFPASLVAIGVGIGGAGCELLYPTHLLGDQADGATSVMSDAAGGQDSDVDAACDAALPPGPPVSPPAGDAGTTIYAAVQTISFTPFDGGVLGYDLDGVCTCPGPGSCVPVAASGTKVCDGPGGRDTAGNATFSKIDGFLAAAGGDINARIARGRMTLVVWIGAISGYDGDKNQGVVGLSLPSSLGLDAPDGSVPKWDGTDRWTIDISTVAGFSPQASGAYTYVPRSSMLESGYVTNRQVVVTDAGFKLGLGVAAVPVTGAIVAATIDAADGGVYRLRGQITGRVSVSALFALVASIPDPSNPSEPLCGSDPTYEAFQTSVCQAADLASSPADDNVPGQPCDAVSIAFAFTAVSMTPGQPLTPSYPPAGCGGAVPTCP